MATSPVPATAPTPAVQADANGHAPRGIGEKRSFGRIQRRNVRSRPQSLMRKDLLRNLPAVMLTWRRPHTLLRSNEPAAEAEGRGKPVLESQETQLVASEAGDLARNVLATGGVYLAGGIALHLVKLPQKPQFVHTLTRKDRFTDLMERTPIHMITTRAAFFRAATFGLQSLSKLKNREEAKASLTPV